MHWYNIAEPVIHSNGLYFNTDTDECAINTDGCDQICINTNESFYCSCNTGYRLNVDNKTCNDVNECMEILSGCNQTCTNTIGSYECSCNTGYSLELDNMGCTRKYKLSITHSSFSNSHMF